MTDKNASAASFPLASILFVVFLVLKLTDVIDWSWWWVTAPLWGSILLTFGIVTAVLTIRARR